MRACARACVACNAPLSLSLSLCFFPGAKLRKTLLLGMIYPSGRAQPAGGGAGELDEGQYSIYGIALGEFRHSLSSKVANQKLTSVLLGALSMCKLSLMYLYSCRYAGRLSVALSFLSLSYTEPELDVSFRRRIPGFPLLFIPFLTSPNFSCIHPVLHPGSTLV